MKSSIVLMLGVVLLKVGLANAAPTSQDFEIQKVGPRTFFVKTGSGKTETIGSHSGAILLPKGLLIVDTHASPEVERDVIAALFKIVNKMPSAAINTHHHDDHTGGNIYYYNHHQKVYAHPNAVVELRKINRPAEAMPLSFAQELLKSKIEIINIGPGHSDGDVIIFDKKDKVLYMGDLFVNGYVGYLGEAHFKEWITALNKILKMPVRVVVPGHGPLATLKEVAYFRTYLIDFVASAKAHFEKTGQPGGYQLPEKYKNLGAQFYLPENVERAFELWKKGLLTIN